MANSVIIKFALEIAIAVIIVIIGLTCAVLISNDIMTYFNRRNARNRVKIVKMMTKDEFEEFKKQFEKDEENDSD